jgi:hypothetical protein
MSVAVKGCGCRPDHKHRRGCFFVLWLLVDSSGVALLSFDWLETWHA